MNKARNRRVDKRPRRIICGSDECASNRFNVTNFSRRILYNDRNEHVVGIMAYSIKRFQIELLFFVDHNLKGMLKYRRRNMDLSPSLTNGGRHSQATEVYSKIVAKKQWYLRKSVFHLLVQQRFD